MLHDKGKGNQIEAEQVSWCSGRIISFLFRKAGGDVLIKSGSGSEQVKAA